MVSSATSPAPIEPTDTLYMPHRRRLFHEWGESEGQRTLTLHYGDKEVLFDDPEQIPFGEALLVHPRFAAAQSIHWTAAPPLAWDCARELLEVLVAEGILAVERPEPGRCPVSTPPMQAVSVATVPSPPVRARTWTVEDTPRLSRELFGIEADVGHLESLLRGWQIPHPIQDVRGRQLGDENVFPPELQVESPTEKRTCRYAGSRYEHDAPMNVTGLRLVQEGWDEALAILHLLKAEFLQRRAPTAGGLQVAELLAFATTVLTLPVYLVHRRERPMRSGELSVGIAALFRIIDGTRLASRSMLLRDEAGLGMSSVPTPDSFYAYCDKHLLLVNGTQGVCAGPPATIVAFLGEVMRTDVDQDAIARLSAERRLAIGDPAAALDYGCAALELELVLDCFWIGQSEIARDLHAQLVAAEPSEGSTFARLRARLETMLARPQIIPFLAVPPGVSSERVVEGIVEVIRTCRALRGLDARLGEPLPAFPERTPIGTDEHGDASSLATARAHERLSALEHETFIIAARRQTEINAQLGRATPVAPFGPRHAAQQWRAASLRAQLGVAPCAEPSDTTPIATPPGLVDPPRALTDEGFAVLRRLFARARFGLASAVRHEWNVGLDSDLEAARAIGELTRTTEGWPSQHKTLAVPLELLVRLFLASGELTEAELGATLAPDEIEALTRSGLIVARSGVVSSPYAVTPIDGLYVVTDRASTIDDAKDQRSRGPNALVMPGYLETYELAQRLHRHPVPRSLDLCTGSGVHALLGSRYARESIGTDISPRAIAFAEWNRRLNQIDRARFLVSDAFAALGDARFDRITANPPYQPDSTRAPGESWWGAGPRGDEIIVRIVAALPDHLAPDGELQMIGRFFSWTDGTAEDRLRRALGSSRDDFAIALDTDPEPLSEIAAMYPNEPLPGLQGSEYGVVTITRLR